MDDLTQNIKLFEDQQKHQNVNHSMIIVIYIHITYYLEAKNYII
jgi:hypothetical protein